MHIDARTLENHSKIEGDICIIGAGAAGIGMALEWLNTPYSIILLEGGGFDYDDKVQNLFKGRTTGQKYYPLKSSRLHYFGGTTGHWGGFCAILDPLAYKKREWVAESGWPFDEHEMEGYYRRAQQIVDISEYSYDTDYWLKKHPYLEPLPLDKSVFWSKIWRYRVPSARRFGTDYRDMIVNSKNVHLYTYAHVTEIKANASVSAITELVVKNYAGKEHTVRARHFIMACCAIQNSRLLLASNKQAPAGIGNDNDLVGRYFMENAEIKSGELWLKDRSEMRLYIRNPEPNLRAELALTAEKQTELRILNGMLSFTPLERARKIPPFVFSWTSDDPREARKKIKEIYDKADDKGNMISRMFEKTGFESFEITLKQEQAPNPLSRVTLDKEVDELGVPRPRLNWAFTPQEKFSARTIYKLLGQQVGIAGIGRVRLYEEMQDDRDDTMPPSTSGGWHHMGTTRMNTDPRKGVVDANCKVHGIANLHIASSSCFPNGGAVNPTLTIIALSLRLADHLKSVLLTERNSGFA